MKIPVVSLFAVLLGAQLAAQGPTSPDLSSDPRVRWLQKEAINVRTVDPADADFRDLQSLRKVIGDARIVMLGEMTHGDGTSMLAKSRLVRFLHQQMNFDVLVFESGLYDTSKAWESIRQGQEPVAALQQEMPPIWSRSPQVKGLWDYIRTNATSPRPLALAGFTGYASGNLLGDLSSLVAGLGIESDVTTPGSPARALAVDLLGGKYGPQGLPAPDPAARQVFYSGLDVLRDRLAAATTAANEARTSFWRQVVLSLRSQAELRWGMRENGYKDPDWSLFNLMDGQGADNLVWLADHQYRGKKLIVWGATAHLMRHASEVDPNINPTEPQRPYTTMVPMGEQLWRRIGTRAFVIGFTCYEGSNGFGDPANKERYWHAEVRRDQDPSIELEELLNAARFDYAVVDFRKPAAGGEWLKTPIVSRPLASQGMRAVWPEVLDAMFFIRVMEPNLAIFPR
jgi:erythromycin esterase